ncbi:MAG TPA: NAD(P)-binding domain-containing protein, partial [Thermoleophilaceae bacterium]|nr:NAD(P)-binding domain-containing protein [Thermoleophilaceae bacterium]
LASRQPTKETEMAVQRVETVIVGGGQAGLATGYHLAREGRSFVILDASRRVGDPWRKRWDSLRLYSPAAYDGLPGLPFPKARASFPTAREMADYLETYAERFELPVHSGTAVEAVGKDEGGYVLTAGDQTYEADNVVVATGVMQKPYVPSFAKELDPRITQLHSSDYRNLTQLQAGRVLVVGASHSGADIAYEAATEHETVLSGTDTGQIPASVETRRGRMGFRALFFVGSRILTVDTPLGRKMRPHIRHGGAPLLRHRKKDLLAAGVERVFTRMAGVQDGLPVLDDGRVLDVQNVIWCTGFRRDFSWIDVPFEMGADGYPVQYRGVVESAPGLYFVGLLFLHSFTSMLIRGSGKDAVRVAQHIVSERSNGRLPAPARAPLVDGMVS